MSNWRSQKTHLFLRFFFPYAVLLFTVLTVGVVFHLQAKRFIEDEVVKANLAVLEQTRDLVDIGLRGLEQIIQQIRQNRDLSKLKYTAEPYAADRVMWVIDAVRNLYAYGLGNPMILDYFVLFPRSDLVVGAGKAFSLQYFYSQVLPIRGMTLDEFKATFVAAPAGPSFLPRHTVTVGDSSRPVVVYLGSLQAVDSTNALVIVLIDQHYLTQALDRIGLSHGGGAIIHDGASVVATVGADYEHVLSGVTEEGPVVRKERIGSQEMVITSVPSSYNSWRFTAIQPTSFVLEPVIRFRAIAIAILFCGLLADLSLSLFLARRSTRPVLSVLEVIQDYDHGDDRDVADEFVRIRAAFEDLIRHDRDLSERLARQRLAVQTTVLNRLLSDGFGSEAEARRSLESVGIEADAPFYQVAVFRFPSGDTEGRVGDRLPIGIAEVAVADALRRAFGVGKTSHVAGIRYPTVILFAETAEYDETRRRLRQAMAELGVLASTSGVVGIGAFRSTLTAVSRSHEEALIAASVSEESPASIREFRDVDLSKSWFYLPQEVEARLSVLMATGDTEELRFLLATLREENFGKRLLAPSVQRVLVESMCTTVVRTTRRLEGRGRVDLQDLYQLLGVLPSMDDLGQAFDRLADFCATVARSTAGIPENRTVTFVVAADKVLTDRFADPSICLDSVATRMGVSSFHLSKSFSNYFGKTFHVRLEEIRMAKARTLLTDTNLPVSEIAEAVGFASANSFAKAFRRVHGTSASTYRLSARVL